jgi:uncharacterized protein
VFVIDTNLLLYAVNSDAREHEGALSLLREWREGERPWFLTWGIAYEFLRVSSHPAVFPEPLSLGEAEEWLRIFLDPPGGAVLVETERHGEVLRELTGLHPQLSGNIVHDFHTAVLMREHGISEIRTADTDFHQFPFLEVVNPLTQRPSS